jgi:hypothetical protein
MTFWRNLSYEKRNGYLLLFALLFGVLVWRLSLSATYELFVQNGVLESQLQQAENAPLAIEKMQSRASRWEQMALAYTATQNDAQKQLFARVSETCAGNQVVLRELVNAGGTEESGTRIETFRVLLEGNFHALLKATRQLEEDLQGGRLVSVQFQKINDRRNRRVYLQGTLYVQSIMKEAYEKD